MTDTYVESAMREIEAWEKEEPGVVSRVSNSVLQKAQKAVGKLVPEAVTRTVETALRGCLEGLMFGADYTFSDSAVLKRLAEHDQQLATREAVSVSTNLSAMDAVARHYWNWNIGLAVAEGGITGAGGLAGLAANIPALLTIVFRMLQQVALCYGYEAASREEKAFLLQVLRVGASSDLAAKQASLVYLRQIEVELIRKTWKVLAGEKALMAMLREFAKTLGISLTKRKALQLVPIVGGLIGASFDGTFVNDVGRAAYMCYRRRKLSEHGLVQNQQT